MKLSAKSRYALAATISMAMTYETQERTTLIHLSETLKISKIYLEHIFSLLKRGGVVTATKGSQGGYLLRKPPHEMTAYDIIKAVDPALFAKNVDTVQDSIANIEHALKALVYSPLDDAIETTLATITLSSLVSETEKNNDNYMYYL